MREGVKRATPAAKESYCLNISASWQSVSETQYHRCCGECCSARVRPDGSGFLHTHGNDAQLSGSRPSTPATSL
jgi:hypothetical protein